MTNDIISNTKEKEMKVRLEDLKKCLMKRSEVTIIGHDNIDVDSVLSGVLLERLCKYLKLNVHFEILQLVNKDETYEIINKLTGINMETYEKVEEDNDRSLFLIDHYETKHNGRVVGCIDHHPTEKKNTYEFSYVRNCTAAAYLIYELMQVSNYPLTAEDAKLIVVAMMVDTTAFRSSKAIPEEVEEAKSLTKRFDLDYEYLEKYCLCLTPIEGMNVEEITSNGQKEYNYNGHKVKSAYLQLDGIPDDDTLNSWLYYLKDKITNKMESTELMVFIIFDIKENITYEYQINNRIKLVIHNGILSRGKDIMPKVEKSFY